MWVVIYYVMIFYLGTEEEPFPISMVSTLKFCFEGSLLTTGCQGDACT